MQSQKKFPRTFSFEFFQPNTPEGQEKLRATTRQLAQLQPKFFSVTYGAGGSTRERTLGTVLDIRAMGHAAAPHISCIASTRESSRSASRSGTHRSRHVDSPAALGVSSRNTRALVGHEDSGDPLIFRLAPGFSNLVIM